MNFVLKHAPEASPAALRRINVERMKVIVTVIPIVKKDCIVELITVVRRMDFSGNHMMTAVISHCLSCTLHFGYT